LWEKERAYLRVPKMCADVVSLLTELQRDDFMHFEIESSVVD